MAISKITTKGIADDSVTSAKLAAGAVTINDIPDGEITMAKLSQVNLDIAPEILEIQVAAPAAGQDIAWLWTWEQSTLPYARRTITNSPEVSVPLYKQGTYTVNNFAAYDLFGDMTQTHTLYFKWIDSAGTDNLISWATSTGPVSDSHPDINVGAATDVQRISINVPATITLPTLTAPSVSYAVTNNGAGAYTFSGSAAGDNPNIGPMYRGGTYTFNVTATGHPFYFTTDNGTNFSSGAYFGEYTDGVTGSRTDSGTVTIVVPNDAPDTLYYQCGNHSSMRGAITIKDLAVEVNNNGNYVVYAMHTQEGHKTPIELRPIPSLVNQMCLVYDAASGKFVPQDLATYVENTPSFENKIREVAGTAELVVEDGSAVIAKVNVYDDSTYLPLVGNNPGDQAFATDTDILYIWDGSAWQQAGAANTDDLAEGTTNLFYTDARVASYLSANDFDTATNIVASITDSAPATLDTLNELAAALGDDPNFATTTANNIALKAPIDNPTFTGTITTPAIIVDTTNPQIQFHPGAEDDWRMQMDDSSKWINFIYNGGTKASIKNNGQISATSFSGDGSSITNVNATTLDSIDSTSFLRSDTSDTMSGILTVISALDAPIVTQSTDPTTGITFTDSDGTGYLHFVGGSDHFYTQSNLHVGGSTSPSEKLHVSGTIQAGTAGNSSANLPALRVYASGTNSEQSVIAIQQGASEGDTIIFADYEPHVEFGINTENSADAIDFTSGVSTGSIGVSKTLYNNSGTARTAHVKVRVNLNSGILEVGGGVKGAFVEYNTTLSITLAGGNNSYTWSGFAANVWMAMSVHVSSTDSDQDDHYDIKIGPNADYGSTWGDTYPSSNVPYGFGIVTHPGDSQGFAGGHYGLWAEVIAKTNSSGQLIFSIVGSNGGSGVTVRTKGYFLA